MNKEYLKLIAKETIMIINNKEYKHRITGTQKLNCGRSELVTEISYKITKQPEWFNYEGNVINKGAIDATIELDKKYIDKKICILNFASAKNPGGGFQNGTVAQEETIARASTLFYTLNKFKKEFYDYNKELNSPLYSNRIIYSSDIEVFRDDACNLLSQPIVVDVITSPAPNAGICKRRGISDEEVDEVLKNRIYNIIQLAVEKKVEILVLGAFGCGVFKNDSIRVAFHFKNAINQLIPKGSMIVKFAILGRIPNGFN